MSNSKQPGLAFSSTVVVVVAPVSYFLSSGPAIWTAERINNEIVNACLKLFYTPIAWISENGPEPMHNLISW